ncbi:hypothetical protein CEXT_402161 [Caerostris extrusa]|uniref:Uncharacterized protein n=1 Tax=Caerostris extrusa TaxID=172846 RepID=A0AAV4WJZ2_CAEEX|nr:hypothetical protein CEXT_402161 [Caerostris extrusa]
MLVSLNYRESQGNFIESVKKSIESDLLFVKRLLDVFKDVPSEIPNRIRYSYKILTSLGKDIGGKSQQLMQKVKTMNPILFGEAD